MRINGVWVGWGLGDNSTSDMTVRNIKAFMRRMYKSYAGNLADTNYFDYEMQAAVKEMQRRLQESGRLTSGKYIPGVLDLATQIAMGFKKAPPRALPIIFTVEGHMSNQFFGPCASTASQLEAQGVCHWKPVGDWDTVALPFKNGTGVEALYRQLSQSFIEGPPVDPNNPDGPKVMWPFPPDHPWGGTAFSQGAMIFCEFMWKYVLPPSAPLHYRLKGFRRGLMYGNPRRAKDAVCSWAQSPPSPGTHGIMDKLFDANKEGIGDRWAEHPNDQDMFAEVDDDEAGRDQTAIAKIITENGWGGPAGIFARVLAIFGNPVGGIYSAIRASFDAIMFLASNPNPHYSTYSTAGDVEWMRGVAQ